VILQHVDVTARRRAREDACLRAALLDVADAAVVAVDLDGLVTAWSQGAQRLYGWTQDEVIGRPLIELHMGAAAKEQVRGILSNIAENGVRESRCEVTCKDGSTVPVLIRDAAMYASDGELTGVVGVAVDLTEIADAERQLRAARDFSRAVTDSMGEGVCALDVDGRLVYMNTAAEEMLGWSFDEIEGEPMHELIHSQHADGTARAPEDCLILSAHHTGATIREDDTFIRRDGTSFPVAYTAAPFETADGFRGSAYVFSDITERKADRERLEHEVEALSWIPKIRDAFDEQRFVVHAQPIIDLDTGQTVQHELLIRMHDAEGGLVPPGLFLPVAEEHGLIADIDRWVIREAARLAGRGHAIELNISAESLAQPGLLEYVEDELRRTGADPGLVVFELTETALLRSEETAQGFIDGLAHLGCKLALDDFGTGYGGFTYLKRFPVDYLKIDIEFVRDLPRDEASQHVVHAVVNLARGFGQQTVAEGVEDAETLALLKEFGVDYAQGYFLGRPAPLAETIEARRR
jgi:PAS domain S-box-containing protein